jgi:hypothetical protein
MSPCCRSSEGDEHRLHPDDDSGASSPATAKRQIGELVAEYVLRETPLRTRLKNDGRLHVHASKLTPAEVGPVVD